MIHNSYLADGFFETLGGVYPCGTAGTMAFGLKYINYGSIEKRDTLGNLEGTYTPFDVSASGAFGFPLDKDVFLGFNSQWIRQDINGVTHMGLLWDMGFFVKPVEVFSLGLNLKNLGVETGGYNLPTELMVGAAFRLTPGKEEQHVLFLTGGGDISFQDVSRLNGGFEYRLLKQFFLRGGYSYSLADNQLGWSDGLDFGAGVRISQFQFDYSFSFMGDLGNVQRFGLSYFFPSAAKPVASATAPVTIPASPVQPAVPINPLPTLPNQANHPVTLKFQVAS
jgi:hypothetical protein